MNSDFGIPNVLNYLSPAKVKKIVKYLKEEVGVKEVTDLKYVNENHLTKDKLLTPIEALKLIEYWKEELLSAAEAPSGPSGGKAIQQDVKANTGRVIAVGRDYNEKHSQAETINQFEKVEDVYLGGSSKKAKIDIGGNAQVTNERGVIGIGDSTTTGHKEDRSGKRKQKENKKKRKKQKKSSCKEESSGSSNSSGSDSDSEPEHSRSQRVRQNIRQNDGIAVNAGRKNKIIQNKTDKINNIRKAGKVQTGGEHNQAAIKISGKARVNSKNSVMGIGSAIYKKHKNDDSKNVYNVHGGIKGHGAFSKDYKTEVAKGATLNQNIS